MRFTVSSNGGLERLQQRLERVARGEHRRRMAEAAAVEVRALVAEEFPAGQDPAGQSWATKADGAESHLTKTGTLADSFDISADEDGVSIANSTPYAGFHQGGTSRMPERQMVPEDGLPIVWRVRINEAAASALREELEG